MTLPVPLSHWLSLIERDPAVHLSDDLDAEAQANLWRFSPAEDDDLSGLDAAALAQFVERAAAVHGAWLRERQAGPVNLYCWHDGETRQLRLGMVAARHGRAPFSRAYREIDDLMAIVRVVVDDWLEQETALPEDASASPADRELHTWRRTLP